MGTLNSLVPIYTHGWREALSEVSCPRTQHNVPGQMLKHRLLDLEASTLTMRPSHP